MRFRFRAFGIHLMASAVALSLILGSLYSGWYHWPGWYLAAAVKVSIVMAGVDLVLGPLLTFIIASATKPRAELRRDIAIIVVFQLAALGYGAVSLWNGRPLYYAFSVSELSVIQAYDISAQEAAAGQSKNAALAPHWYSTPRWIWAPLPDDAQESGKIIASAVSGGDDVTSMPRYFRPWNEGLPALRQQLKKVAEIRYFSHAEAQSLEAKMRAAGLPTDQANSLPFAGRGRPLLAVFDPNSLALLKIVKPNAS